MVNFDVDAQEIEQRRKYAEMLRQQGMEPVQSQMAGGYVIPVSPVQGLAKMLQAYSGRKGMETADADKRALAEALRNERMGTLERFQGAMEGRPEEQGTDPTGGLTVNPAQAPNPKAAMMALATSRDPALSQAGIGAYLAQLSKTPESPFGKINPKDFTPESVRAFAAGGGKDFAVLVPRDKMEFVNEGGQITPRNPYTGLPVASPIALTPKPANPYSDLVVPGPNGTVVPNTPLVNVRKEIANSGRPNVNSTVINAGPKAFENELGKLDAEKLGEWRKGAESANSVLQTVRTLREAVDQGVFSGGGAKAKTEAANLISGITGVKIKNLPGSQLFNAEASKLVLEHVKTLGANPSNADRDFIEKTVPMLTTSPEARDAMINFIERKAKQAIDLYTEADEYARKNRGLGGFSAFKTPAVGGQWKGPERRAAPSGFKILGAE